MAVIPDKIYRLVEEKLRNRHTLIPRAQAVLQRVTMEAIAPPGQATDGDRVKRGKPGNRTQAAALRILDAEEKMSQAEAWVEAFRLVERVFPPGTPEGNVAACMYDRGMSQEDVCRVFRCDRQTIRRRRDNYVVHAALIAASRGLITIEPE